MIKTGYVGFFDILGYQNIIDNNEIEKASAIISNLLLALPQKVSTKILSLISEEKKATREKLSEYFSAIKPLLVSDSILISMEIDVTTDLLTLA